MFFGIAGIALMAFTATVATDEVWNGLSASWSMDSSTNFYTLPSTLDAAIIEGWTFIEGVTSVEGITPLGFEGDPTLVLLFENGEVIGVQIAFRVADLDPDQPLKWDNLDGIIKKTLLDESYYTGTVYFWNDESTGSRRFQFQQKNVLREISTNASLVPSETEFLKKKCVATMGTHYYTWHNTSDCATVSPWLVLADGDNIVGIALQGFGSPTQIGNRTWWEYIPAIGLYTVMSDPPLCAYEAISEYGIISLHVWFVAEPKKITCS